MKFDYTNVWADQIGPQHGISESDLGALQPLEEKAHQHLKGLRTSEKIGFFELPYNHDVVQEIRSYAAGVNGTYDDIVVLGIGGSALGAIALQTALSHPHTRRVDGFPRLHVLDNVDPDFVSSILDVVDLEKTLFIVITKSGGTGETMSQFAFFRKVLVDRFGEAWTRHMVAVTDREKGDLRKIVERENLTSFVIPGNVGGRFSVLTAVGLLPAALAGYDIAALMEGAAQMDQACRSQSIMDNPAYLYAAIHYLMDVRKGKRLSVMMPYANRLRDVADWYRQLWAESLGKKMDLDGNLVHVGQTPIKALGATDQHSQVQLYVEGPNDKTIVFLRVEDFGATGDLPESYADIKALNYLAGHSFAELINAEQTATAIALTQAQRPNLTITMPRVSAYEIGQLFYLLELATAYAGALYNIDPFNQPGVEAGKIATYALMGRPGYESQREEIEAIKANQKERIIEI